ncbi:hypothetical protein D3C84_807990 [compost metagenome]
MRRPGSAPFQRSLLERSFRLEWTSSAIKAISHSTKSLSCCSWSSPSSAELPYGSRSDTRGDNNSLNSRRRDDVSPSRLNRFRQRYKSSARGPTLTRPPSSSRHRVRIRGPGTALGAPACIRANSSVLSSRSSVASRSKLCSIHEAKLTCKRPPQLMSQSNNAGSSR